MFRMGAADAALSRIFDVGHGGGAGLLHRFLFLLHLGRRRRFFHLLATTRRHPQPGQRPAQIQLARQIKLVPSRGLVKRFVRMTIGEVEGGAPSPFVEEGGEVVVGVDEGGVVGGAFGDGGGGVEAFVGGHRRIGRRWRRLGCPFSVVEGFCGGDVVVERDRQLGHYLAYLILTSDNNIENSD